MATNDNLGSSPASAAIPPIAQVDSGAGEILELQKSNMRTNRSKGKDVVTLKYIASGKKSSRHNKAIGRIDMEKKLILPLKIKNKRRFEFNISLIEGLIKNISSTKESRNRSGGLGKTPNLLRGNSIIFDEKEFNNIILLVEEYLATNPHGVQGNFETRISEKDIPVAGNISIYLSEGSVDDLNKITKAVSNFVSNIGYDLDDNNETKRGSWIRTIKYKIKKGLSRKEVASTVNIAGDVLYGHLTSEADSRLMSSLSEMLKSIDGIKNVVIDSGPFLIIKISHSENVSLYVKRLTLRDRAILNENASILEDPYKVLASITNLYRIDAISINERIGEKKKITGLRTEDSQSLLKG